MMDPGSVLITAAPYLMAASAGISAISAVMGGQQRSAAFQAQAAADERNADQARVNAAVQMNQAEAEAARTDAATRRRSAAAYNLSAASGGDPSYGSPLDLMADIAAEGALDSQIQRWKGTLAAQGMLAQANGLDAQAGFNRNAGDAAATAGFIQGGASLLNAGASYGMANLRLSRGLPSSGIMGGLDG